MMILHRYVQAMADRQPDTAGTRPESGTSHLEACHSGAGAFQRAMSIGTGELASK